MQEDARPAGVPREPLGDVIDLSVQDHPAVLELLVLGYLLAGVAGQRVSLGLGRGGRHSSLTVCFWMLGEAAVSPFASLQLASSRYYCMYSPALARALGAVSYHARVYA